MCVWKQTCYPVCQWVNRYVAEQVRAWTLVSLPAPQTFPSLLTIRGAHPPASLTRAKVPEQATEEWKELRGAGGSQEWPPGQ